MKTLLSRSTFLGALLLLPGCASLAQDPEPYRNVRYSAEELDNLVAPVALYPDALLAQILVAATFPEQVAIASRHVRERGTRNIDDQGWDISVKAVAYYPPVLNMLANDEDWAVALGQAYASQSADLMDAVQRLREMAREQGNLVSTREHTVTEDRGRIIIVPANPQVIYVPTYDPAIVYVRPIFGFGFHTGYFSFGIGFPIGSWLAYDMDWWGHSVYYDGWYGDGWRYRARRYFPLHHVYVRPRYSMVNININIFSRRVNYINLDRRHRYVRRSVVFERHDRGGRYTDRDGRRDDDRRGPYVAPRGDDRDGSRDGDRRDGGRPAGRGDDSNDRIGNRVATFDDYRPDRGRNGSDARDAEPPVGGSGFDVIEKGNGTTRQPRGNNDAGGNTRGSSADARGSRPNVPVFTSLPRSGERKATGNARPQSDQSGNARPEVPVFRSQPRANEGKSKGNGSSQGSELRSAPRANAPVYSAPQRSTERKSGGNGGGQRSEIRSTPRSSAPVFSAPQRSVERKSGGGGGGGQRSEIRSAPRSSAPVFSAPQRSVERKSGGGGGGAQFSRPSVRESVNRPAKSSSPSVARSSSGGGSGSFTQSGGAKGGGGKVRK